MTEEYRKNKPRKMFEIADAFKSPNYFFKIISVI